MLAFWLGLQVAMAGELVVPGFTPGTVGDFGPAERLTEVTLQALDDAGIPFVMPSEVIRRGGESVVGCADRPACPEKLFEVFSGATLAVVGSTTWANGRLDSEVRFYARGDPSPVEVLQASFRPEDAVQFANEIARIVDEILLFNPAPETTGPAVAREPEMAPLTPSIKERSRDRLGDERVRLPTEDGVDRGPMPRAWYGLPDRARKRYLVSGMEWRQWRREKALRTGRFEIGVLGGMGFGDISRSYDIRVALNEPTTGAFEEIGVYQHHDFLVDRGMGGGFYLSFAPAWWVDLGLIAGIQTGEKQLSTGWEHYLDGQSIDSDVKEHEPALAVMGVLEPRLRLFFVPLGPVKPYLAGGMGLRFIDGYEAPDLDDVAYPDLAGSMDPVINIGGGLSLDLPMGLSVILDIPWSFRLASQPLFHDYEGHGLSSTPQQVAPAGQVLSFRGGLGYRL